MIQPKSKRSGIMVSDFVKERNGYLALTPHEYDKVKESNPMCECMHVNCLNMENQMRGTGLLTILLTK